MVRASVDPNRPLEKTDSRREPARILQAPKVTKVCDFDAAVGNRKVRFIKTLARHAEDSKTSVAVHDDRGGLSTKTSRSAGHALYRMEVELDTRHWNPL
jgi:hypothetical protein